MESRGTIIIMVLVIVLNEYFYFIRTLNFFIFVFLKKYELMLGLALAAQKISNTANQIILCPQNWRFRQFRCFTSDHQDFSSTCRSINYANWVQNLAGVDLFGIFPKITESMNHHNCQESSTLTGKSFAVRILAVISTYSLKANCLLLNLYGGIKKAIEY